MMLRWSTQISEADWIRDRLHDFAMDVGSVIPDCFAAYARVFHPIDVNGQRRRWSRMAAENGRIAHPEMQYHLISTPPGMAPSRYEPLRDMDVGSLPPAELTALVEVLANAHAPTSRCFLAVWEGYGHLLGGTAVFHLTSGGHESHDSSGVAPIVPPDIAAAPRVDLPGRSYVLLEAPLTEIPEVASELWGQSPNLWWPEDRSWCVATEIDFGWTYVGGPNPLIDQVLSDHRLEALPSSPTHGCTYHSDLLNAALDADPVE